MSPEDMAEALLRGMGQLDRMLLEMAESTGVPQLSLQAYLRFRGHESFFKDLLTCSGFQQSSLFEVRVAAEEFIRLSLRSATEPELLFTMQAMYGNQKGPDLVRLFDDLLQIVESKSWAAAWMLGQPGGTVARQLERFIAFDELGYRFTLPSGLSLPTHRTIIVRINLDEYARLRRMSAEAVRPHVDAWLLDMQSTLDDIYDNTGFTAQFELDPLYINWNR
jgi:hypothetical protein